MGEQLFNDTDNFFKYLLSIGIIAILFAVIYPLKKEQQLKVEYIEIQKKENQIVNNIEKLKNETAELKNLQSIMQFEVDELKKKENEKNFLDIEKQKLEISRLFDDKKNKLIEYSYDIDSQNISLKYTKEKHEEIQKQIWEYAAFKAIFEGVN